MAIKTRMWATAGKCADAVHRVVCDAAGQASEVGGHARYVASVRRRLIVAVTTG